MILEKEILIGNKTAKLVETTNINGVQTPILLKKSIDTTDYFKNLNTNMSIRNNCIMPRNCRYFESLSEKATLLVLEEKPSIRSVRFSYNFKAELDNIEAVGQSDLDVKRFIDLKTPNSKVCLKLSFPYIVFIAYVKEYESDFEVPTFKVFFRTSPLGDLNDYLYIANLFNLSDSNSLCFGRSGLYSKSQYPNMTILLDELRNDFWIRPFKPEYRTRHNMYSAHSILHSFLVWAHYSQTDPRFIFSTDLILHGLNLNGELNSYKSDRVNNGYSVFLKSINQTTLDNKVYHFENFPVHGKNKLLSLGDQIKYNDQNLFIYEIIGNSSGPNQCILINEESNEKTTVEITNDLKEDWSSQIDNQLYNYLPELKFGDKKIRPGDIIKIVPTGSYEIVNNIRINRDKKYELILGSKFYIATLDAFEVIDSIKINDIELKPNHKYLIFNNQYQTVFEGVLSKIETSNNKIVYFYFKNSESVNERGISLDSFQNFDVFVLDIDDHRVINPKVFWYLNKLYVNLDELQNFYTIIKNIDIRLEQSNVSPGVYTNINKSNNNKFDSYYNQNIALDNILTSVPFTDKKILNIPGVDFDIHFETGDQIIVGDWNDPDNLMFKIRTITNFIIEDSMLKFEAEDSDGNKKLIPYLDTLTGEIRVGYIRKVTTELNGIKVGSIIRPKNKKYPLFSTTENYLITAIIIDSEPLVLCKNGLTIWFKDLIENFHIFAPNTTRHRSIRKIQEINLDKIKPQAGDLYCQHSNNDIWVLNSSELFGVFFTQINASYIKSGVLTGFYTEDVTLPFSFYGILNPRYYKKDSKTIYETIPNFHNGFSKTNLNGYYSFTDKK